MMFIHDKPFVTYLGESQTAYGRQYAVHSELYPGFATAPSADAGAARWGASSPLRFRTRPAPALGLTPPLPPGPAPGGGDTGSDYPGWERSAVTAQSVAALRHSALRKRRARSAGSFRQGGCDAAARSLGLEA